MVVEVCGGWVGWGGVGGLPQPPGPLRSMLPLAAPVCGVGPPFFPFPSFIRVAQGHVAGKVAAAAAAAKLEAVATESEGEGAAAAKEEEAVGTVDPLAEALKQYSIIQENQWTKGEM